MKILCVCLLPLYFACHTAKIIPTLQDDILQLDLQDESEQRWRRSGGYPKFPISNTQNNVSCGTRNIIHEPRRSGAPYPKIIGGTTVPYGSYPWQVEIKMLELKSGMFKHHCGGALISEHLIVSAAHCLYDADADLLRIVVGDYHLGLEDKHERMYSVEKIVTHPLFRRVGPYSNDIGLIKVNTIGGKGIPFNSHVRSICLPETSARNAPGSWCTVTGWGAQQADDPESLSKVLQAASVPLLELDTCRKDSVYGGRTQSILDSMLCAGLMDGGVDACGGDSGGPLACDINGKFVLTGVVSWGDGCAKKNRPGVYTRVSHYTDWIEASKKKLGL